MHIKSIIFSGFKSERRNARVDFSQKNVTIIYGDNGCGKTTFLKALTAFLSQDEDSLRTMGINQIKCTLGNENNEEKEFNIKINLHENGYDWSDFNESDLGQSKSLSLGIERGISTQSIRIEPDAIYDFFLRNPRYMDAIHDSKSSPYTRRTFQELSDELSFFLRRRNSIKIRNRSPEINFDRPHLYLQSIKIENVEDLLLQKYRIARFTATKKIQSALFDTLSIAIDVAGPQPQAEFDNDLLKFKLMENKERIIEALDDGEENNFKSRIVEILSRLEQPTEMEKIIKNNLLSQLLQNMINELDEEKLVLSSINHLVERFNSYLIDNKKLVVNGKEVYIDIENKKHSLNELSSGERHILTFLGLVLFVGQGRQFLIIDEPEISLNINWQRELMSIFSNLLPDTQIIVASHSPAIAKRNPDYLKKLQVWSEPHA